MIVTVKLRGRVIAELLARGNMSQNELARRLETTTGYMSQLISGVRSPSAAMRRKIMEVFIGHNFDDLFTIRGRK